jgi:acyl dehydratase
VPGQMVCSFLGQLLGDWMGEAGVLRKLSCSYKNMNFPGEALTCKGTVTRKRVEDEEHFVECSLWVENEKGEKTITGKATVVLPSQG